jgi:hypothetical protein
MLLDDFRIYTEYLQRLTVDFVEAVPDDKWDFSPDPPMPGREPIPYRIGVGFAPFSKQLRHLVCVRGVYNDALVTKKADMSRKHEHYNGPLTRESLLAALNDKQQQLLKILKTVDTETPIHWGGTAYFTFPVFTWEFVQHEAIHHGQWSVYASLGGFETPLSWRKSWGL